MPRYGSRATDNLRRAIKQKNWRTPKWRPRLFSYRKGRRL
jgi:hypothetical protein